MIILAIFGTLLSLGAAAASAGAGGVVWAWQASAQVKSRRRAKRAIKPLDKEARRFVKALGKYEAPIKPVAVEYARGRVLARLKEVPLESLRDAGAANVRWSTLENAGYKTLADVEDKTPRELSKVHGIGKKSAIAVARAAGILAQRAREESPRLPLAELSDEAAPELAARTLDLVDAREVAGEDPARLGEKVAGYRSTLAELQSESTFMKWLTTPLRRKQAEINIERAQALTAAAEATAASGLVEVAREGRVRLERWKRPKRDAASSARTFRDRYAECCALLEGLFSELGLRPRKAILSGQGGITDEVARRVEQFSLKTAAMKANLRRYQVFGAKYILAQERTILGDEMGLGKTMQALAAMTHRNEDEAGARFFVVAPAGLLINWEREIQTFTSLAAHVLHGDEFAEKLETWMRHGGVAITSFATLRNKDLGAMLAKLELTINLCAVDEAHYIKNPQSGRTQAVRRLLDCSHVAVLMSGTPMENHPSEFLFLIDAVRPEDGADLRAQQLQLDSAAGSVRAFHAAAAKVYLRRNQEDVLTELPERIEVEEWVELSADERREYNAQIVARNFMGMRRAATVQPDSSSSAKLDRLEELLEDHRESGRKVIIFSYFLDSLARCAERFESVGTISGKLGPQAKQDLCDEFQKQPGHAILLLQIIAGGQGLNLQQASAVVLLEPQLKPTLESQAIARAHRMGQTQRVLVHRLFARATCDESLKMILAEKSEFFEAYARKSLVKEASREATATSIERAVMVRERERLQTDSGDAVATG